jgi:hypothetical protein
MVSFLVKSKTEDYVKCEVVDGGELKSRRHLNFHGKSATLPSITGNSQHFFFFVPHLMYVLLFHTPISNVQTRTRMTLNLVWVIKLITMLSHPQEQEQQHQQGLLHLEQQQHQVLEGQHHWHYQLLQQVQNHH